MMRPINGETHGIKVLNPYKLQTFTIKLEKREESFHVISCLGPGLGLVTQRSARPGFIGPAILS